MTGAAAVASIDDDDVVSAAVERRLRAAGRTRLLTKGAPDVAWPAHMVEAAARASADVRQAPPEGEPALRAAIAERLRAEGIDAEPDRVVVTNGAMHALELCFRVLLDGEGVLAAPEPRFFIAPLVRRCGGVLRGFASDEQAGYRPDWDAGAAAVAPRARALFVNTPVNPTGYVFDDEDCERALALAQRDDLWLISDESYSHFVFGGRRHRSPACLDGASERVLVVRSFSKDYAMSGCRLGYVLVPPKLVTPLRRALAWSCLSVNRVAQMTGLAAVSGPHEWVRAFVADAARRATWVPDALCASPHLSCPPAAGGLNLLLRFAGTADRLVEHLIEHERVSVHPGRAFGAPGRFRFQFGGDETVVRAAIERIVASADLLAREEDVRD